MLIIRRLLTSTNDEKIGGKMVGMQAEKVDGAAGADAQPGA